MTEPKPDALAHLATRCMELTLSFNDHLGSYQTPEDWLTIVGPDEVEGFTSTRDIWHLQVYPDTPVGFLSVVANDPMSAIEWMDDALPRSSYAHRHPEWVAEAKQRADEGCPSRREPREETWRETAARARERERIADLVHIWRNDISIDAWLKIELWLREGGKETR